MSNSTQQDEFAERLRAIATIADKLTSYIVYRAEYTESEELDARASGLIATHNDLVRSLTHFCSQHSFAIPKGQPLPREIYL